MISLTRSLTTLAHTSLGGLVASSTARVSLTPALLSAFSSIALNELTYMPGEKKQKRRVGRGVGSGRGKTCGRGHKGRRARSGGTVKVRTATNMSRRVLAPSSFADCTATLFAPTQIGFEGGQTPFWRRVPKRGFTKPNQKPLETLALSKIENYIAMGRMDPVGSGNGGSITMKDLVDNGLLKKIQHGVKLVASDKIGHKWKRAYNSDSGRGYKCAYPLHLEVSRVSKQAAEAVESAGGSVVATHFNRLALKALLKPDKFDPGLLPRHALPPPKMREYYTQYENRGYLSLEVQLERQLKRLGVEDAVDFEEMRKRK